MPRVPLTRLIVYHHKTEEIGVDVMFVNFHFFLVTKLFNIKLSSMVNMQECGENES